MSRQQSNLIDLNSADFNSIRTLVMENTGISLSTSKMELVKRRYSPRLKVLGIDNFSSYIKYVKSNFASEGKHFCNAITTNLTSFYREKHHFEYLEKTIIPEILKRKKRGEKIRIWSAGCSTGQEAYCLAITLTKAIPDIFHHDIKILATDLDENCLAHARKGSYLVREFEKVPKDIINKHFSLRNEKIKGRDAEVYTADAQLKSLITFNKLNLMNKWPMQGEFDVIFCRNVFIYFDKPTQEKLIKGFAQKQLESNYLCLGHSETVSNPTSLGYKLMGKTLYRRLGA